MDMHCLLILRVVSGRSTTARSEFEYARLLNSRDRHIAHPEVVQKFVEAVRERHFVHARIDLPQRERREQKSERTDEGE